MKFSTLLLGSALTIVSTAALATEVTNPFFAPKKAQIASQTSYTFAKPKYKGTDNQAQSLSELVTYGLTDKVAVFGEFGNAWEKGKIRGQESQSDNDNWNWAVGTALTDAQGIYHWQVSAQYGQRKGFAADSEYKYFAAGGRFGVDVAGFLPYANASVVLPLWQSAENDPLYQAGVGVYKLINQKIAVDAGLSYEHNTNHSTSATYQGAARPRTWNALGEVSYLFCDKLAVSMFGSYLLDQTTRDGVAEQDGSYTIGARLRAAF